MISAEERFLKYVLPEPNSGCWLWTGALRRGTKYGSFWDGKGPCFAHRWSYEHRHGHVERNLVIDHKCRNRICVNPDHLRAVTHKINVTENNDGVCSINGRKTHCKRGHSLSDPQHLRLIPNGRMCKTCHNQRRREMRQLRKNGSIQ